MTSAPARRASPTIAVPCAACVCSEPRRMILREPDVVRASFIHECRRARGSRAYHVCAGIMFSVLAIALQADRPMPIGSLSIVVRHFTIGEMSPARQLCGTDFPYQRRGLAAKSKHVLESAALNDVERDAILGGNASRLLPRLQSVLANGNLAMRRSAARQ
jgi:hypothetical protein